MPEELAASVERLAADQGISRNDALLRLATHGAAIYEMQQRVADVRAARWAAIFPAGHVDLDDFDASDFPTPEEARAAILADRDDEDDDAD